MIKFGHIVLLLLILLYGCIWDILGLQKPNPLPTSFTVILDDTLSFIANIFFLILLIEQLNFLYTICLIKLQIFLFYSRIINTWRWKENKDHGLAGYNDIPFYGRHCICLYSNRESLLHCIVLC